jgi:hypothetical protein
MIATAGLPPQPGGGCLPSRSVKRGRSTVWTLVVATVKDRWSLQVKLAASCNSEAASGRGLGEHKRRLRRSQL